MNTMMIDSATVYSTSTEGGADFTGLSAELVSELRLNAPAGASSMWEDQDWCFVCQRPTDHWGEHDDLVEEGKASYDPTYGVVYSS